MGRTRIGNSGWSYTDWIGSFYPRGTSSSNMLPLYLSRFDTVEVNSTYYSIPGPQMVKRWADEARRWDGREICVKVPGEVSHDAAMKNDPDIMRSRYARFAEAVLRPLSDAGVLGAVLFQASPYFVMRGDIKYRMKSEPKVPLPEYVLGTKKLNEVLEMMSAHPGDVVLELRNSSWIDEEFGLSKEAMDALRAHGAALAVIDGPSFPWIEVETARHNYIRFHGRNKEDWYKGGERSPFGRYEYRYSRAELEGRAKMIKVLTSKVDRDTRIMFNNHPKGYAPMNAIEMMDLLGVERPKGAIDGLW